MRLSNPIREALVSGSSGARRLAVLALSLAAASCASVPPFVPSWIDKPPVDERYIYATGTFWGSLNPNDNEKNALRAAYTQLSYALESQVRSLGTVRDYGSERTGTSFSTVISDAVVKNAEHIETWRDTEGVRGHRSSVWVLVRIEKPKS